MNKMENIKRIFYILIGSLLSAVAINSFIIPHKLLSGGVSGIAIIVQYLAGIPTGYLIIILNIPIFLYGMKEIDKDFIIYSILGTASMAIFLVLTKNLSSFIRVNDILLSTIYGGVIGGIGMGVVLRNRGSQGGTDIIGVALKKKSGISISSVSFAINAFIVAAGAIISKKIEVALYTFVLMYITYYFMERVLEGFDRKKLLFIVTEREKEVSEAIMEQLGRGVTFFYGEGAYTGDRKRVIYCIVSSTELARTKKIVEDKDPTSFISIVDASEVHGRGFKKPAI